MITPVWSGPVIANAVEIQQFYYIQISRMYRYHFWWNSHLVRH